MKRKFILLVLFMIPLLAFNVQVKKRVLSNGLEVLLVPNKNTPVMSFQVWVKTGSRNERPGITGISHMLEHMMFKGSKHYGPEEHARIVKENGGMVNAFTSEDRTVFFDNIAPTKIDLIARLESDRFMYAKIDPDQFKSERKVVYEERLMSVDNSPFGKAFEQLQAMTFIAHPYHWSVIGWPSDILSFTAEKVRKYYEERYNPSNVFILISGNFDEEKTMEILEKYFSSWKKGPVVPPVVTKEPEQRGPRYSKIYMKVNVPFLFAAYRIPPYKNKDIPAIEIASRILGEGESSRIYKSLVQEKGIALQAGGGANTLMDGGYFFSYVMVNLGKNLDEAGKELFSLVENFKDAKIEDWEIEKARNQIIADMTRNLERAFYVGLQVGTSYQYTGDPTFFVKRLEAYKKVTKEDVRRVAAKYFNFKRRNVVYILPEGGKK